LRGTRFKVSTRITLFSC